MTTPRSPEGELLDIMELDREIEALRVGGDPAGDDGLSLLLGLRVEVDRRAAMLLGRHDPVREPQPPCPASASPRRRRRHRLAVIPVAGALVLASTGAAAALSSSPHAPLYPLHQLIFGAAPNSDQQVGRDLAQAQILLNKAAAEPYAARAGELARARALLVQVRSLLPMATSRTRFSHQLSAALARLGALERPPVTRETQPLPLPVPTPPLPEPQVGGEGTAEPEPAPAEAESSGLAPTGGESEAPETRTPAAIAPVPEAPERANSVAPEQDHQQRSDPNDGKSGSSESEPPGD